jgi:hypothetical protein
VVSIYDDSDFVKRLEPKAIEICGI